ncbi:unnamed protein product [Symbiodinium pilosum]|uniref:Uncharacterized protein n=1 Tax=Symbiodinium pilosum TaxID=2952 RepID=A0A812NYK3_SYMPI|nr:unnamed protein product [Symbiodinium pilosum]
MAEKDFRGAAADAAAAAAKVPPPPLPLPPNLTVAQLPKLLRPTGKRRFQAARGPGSGVPSTAEGTSDAAGPASAAEIVSEATEVARVLNPGTQLPEADVRNVAAERPMPGGSSSEGRACEGMVQGDDSSGDGPGQESLELLPSQQTSGSLLSSCPKEDLVSKPPSSEQSLAPQAGCSQSAVLPVLHLLDASTLDKPDGDTASKAKPDNQLAAEVSHILSDVGALSSECDRLFKETCPSGDTTFMRAERLHKLTQRLIDWFGCTSPDTLDRIGHVYMAATSGRHEQGLAQLEFRGYVAAVLTQVLRDLELRIVPKEAGKDHKEMEFSTEQEDGSLRQEHALDEEDAAAAADEESDGSGMMEALQGWLQQLTSSFA